MLLFRRGQGFWTEWTTSHQAEPSQEFFYKQTGRKSQREDWYIVTRYVAEFWCTVSNIGFFYVAWRYNCWELLVAATASVLSHAIPRQWLLTLDKLGVALVISKLARHYTIVVVHPWLIVLLGLSAFINMLDTYVARVHGQTWAHILWHLSSAFVASVVLGHLE